MAPLLLLAGSWSAHAAQVVSFSPAIPQAHQPVFANVALLASERVDGVRVHQYGNVVELALMRNDAIVPGNPPPPPLQDRTESYAIGSLPAGNYQLQLYIGGPSSVLVHTVPLGVAAATPVPALGNWSVLLLSLIIGVLGCAIVGLSRSTR